MTPEDEALVRHTTIRQMQEWEQIGEEDFSIWGFSNYQWRCPRCQLDVRIKYRPMPKLASGLVGQRIGEVELKSIAVILSRQ